MSVDHFVRVGAMGHVGRFESVDARRYPRRSRVVVRTGRGLEIGEILGTADTPRNEAADSRGPAASRHESSNGDSSNGRPIDGEILRGVTGEDRLLMERLEKNRVRALNACEKLLAERDVDAVLVDVEHLFDGQGLFFYFLGDVPPEAAELTAELAEAYEARVRFRQFTDTLLAGCGPDCGTDRAGSGEGCDSCAGCAVTGACGTKP